MRFQLAARQGIRLYVQSSTAVRSARHKNTQRQLLQRSKDLSNYEEVSQATNYFNLHFSVIGYSSDKVLNWKMFWRENESRISSPAIS